VAAAERNRTAAAALDVTRSEAQVRPFSYAASVHALRQVLSFGCVVVAAAAASGCGAPAAVPATAVASAPASGATAPVAVESRTSCDEARSPVEATRAWVRAMEGGNWLDVIACLPPAGRESAREELSSLPPETAAHQMSVVQRTARKVRAALDETPSFVAVAPVLAEPAQLEWYYCGESPAGEMWQSPCAVSVVEVEGRFYVRRVTDAEK
jgi:hypothetical protein